MTPQGLRGSRDERYLGIGSRFFADILARHYERAIRAHTTGRLLDLGCGHVPLYGIYRNLVTENICVDWENTRHVNPLLDQTADLCEELPFAPASFDTVLMTDVLEHLPEPLPVIHHVAAVLRTGGKLILGVPFFYWLHEEPHDYYRYTEHALRRFCALAGLRIVELSSYGGLPEVLVDLTSKGITVLPPKLAKRLRPLHSALSRLGALGPFRKLSEWTRFSVPLGYILIAEKPESLSAILR
jgi:SAM-dependent methyltransferase